MKISAVIIVKNEEKNLSECINSLVNFCDEILVADTGSTDNTIQIALQSGAKVVSLNWEGYGPTKNKAAGIAKNNWILSLDADERLSQSLLKELATLNTTQDNFVFGFKRASFINGKKIRFGSWGRDIVYRLYNKSKNGWNNDEVHESLSGIEKKRNIISGEMYHYTHSDWKQFVQKNKEYSKLSAKKYKNKGKRATFFKIVFSPIFSFFKEYFFNLGILDGIEGLKIAFFNSYFVLLKYQYLSLLSKKNH